MADRILQGVLIVRFVETVVRSTWIFWEATGPGSHSKSARATVANGSFGSEFIYGEMKYIQDFGNKDWISSYSLLVLKKSSRKRVRNPISI